VLNCAIALMLYRHFGQLPEGQLSRLRANLVNQDTLHRLAVSLDLGASIRLGEGEIKSGGTARASILADALEALFGAILLDGGFDAAYAVIEQVYSGELAAVDAAVPGKDPKTRLQEWLQGRKLPVPEYAITGVQGEPHVQTFEVVCRIPALNIAASGSGASRRAAEQAAAGLAYEQAIRR
jgi:ribonuclease III